MKSNHWTTAHVNAYSFLGDVTRILIPNNLKTSVSKNTNHTPWQFDFLSNTRLLKLTLVDYIGVRHQYNHNHSL